MTSCTHMYANTSSRLVSFKEIQLYICEYMMVHPLRSVYASFPELFHRGLQTILVCYVFNGFATIVYVNACKDPLGWCGVFLYVCVVVREGISRHHMMSLHCRCKSVLIIHQQPYLLLRKLRCVSNANLP